MGPVGDQEAITQDPERRDVVILMIDTKDGRTMG